jgi:DNA mismatch endonuclease (patch repair protein)
VDGCYWHGHATHKTLPKSGPNRSLWEEKLRDNRERDARAVTTAQRLGWLTLRFWECDIERDLPSVVDRVLAVTHVQHNR